MNAYDRQEQRHEGGDGRGREHGSNDGQGGNRELLASEVFEIEQKRSGEQKKAEHSVEDQALEIDLLNEPEGPGLQTGRERAGGG